MTRKFIVIVLQSFILWSHRHQLLGVFKWNFAVAMLNCVHISSDARASLNIKRCSITDKYKSVWKIDVIRRQFKNYFHAFFLENCGNFSHLPNLVQKRFHFGNYSNGVINLKFLISRIRIEWVFVSYIQPFFFSYGITFGNFFNFNFLFVLCPSSQLTLLEYIYFFL